MTDYSRQPTYKLNSMQQDDSEVFEMHDFTNVTDFERFSSALEAVLRDWQLPAAKGCIASSDIDCQLKEETSNVELATQFNFTVTHYYYEVGSGSEEGSSSSVGFSPSQCSLSSTILSKSNPFPSRVHCVTRFYGIHEFVVLSCSELDMQMNESRLYYILSAVRLASSNAKCCLPILFRAFNEWRKFYVGSCFDINDFMGDFQMVQLSSIDKYYKTLSGLMKIFNEKLAFKDRYPIITVSINFTYALYDWTDILCSEHSVIKLEDASTLISPTLSTLEDPISGLQLNATWLGLSHDMVEENEHYSDLDPLNAPSWAVRVISKTTVQCLMSEHLTFWWQSMSSPTLSSIIGLDSPLRSKTETDQAIRDRLHKKVYPPQPEDSLTDEVADAILDRVFAFLSASSLSSSTINPEDLKSAPCNSLLSTIAWPLLTITYTYGPSALLRFWSLFITRLRYKFDRGLYLPGVPCGAPNVALSLIHQKFQLINCCVRKCRQSDEFDSNEFENDTLVKNPKDSHDTSLEFVDALESNLSEIADDNFFDAKDVDIGYDSTPTNGIEDEEEIVEVTDRRLTPEGRLRSLDFTLKYSNSKMYVPITQELTPLTEDSFLAQQTLLESIDDSNLRAKIQRKGLLSDMEAFKAANPGCCLQDFIKWYSPRDLTSQGSLSKRMSQPGNVWRETWMDARIVSAGRQAPLFDWLKVGNETFDWLSSLDLHSIAEYSFSSALHNALDIILKQTENLPGANTLHDSLLMKVKVFSGDESDIEDILCDILQLETLFGRAQSLTNKFSRLSDGNELYEDFVQQLLANSSVKIIGGSRGPIGDVLRSLFALASEIQKGNYIPGESQDFSQFNLDNVEFPPPIGKEYVINCECNSPYDVSRSAPQRLYAAFTKDESRLAFAHFEDSKFF